MDTIYGGNKVLASLKSQKTVILLAMGWPERYRSINSKLQFLGFVQYLKDAIPGSLLMVPILTGSGMRMKILDAAAMGVPFITTTVGVEGLDFQHNKSCIIADKPEEFANSINQLIRECRQILFKFSG